MEDEEERPPLAVQIDKPAQERSYSSKNADVSVGVTVITGFLGAGKSTVTYALVFLKLVFVLCFLFLFPVNYLFSGVLFI